MVVTWLLIISLQDPSYDGIWHLHVAWLIEKGELIPFEDFFEHHTPLLWDVLGLYFRLGGSESFFLVFGNAVVLFCGLCVVIGFYHIGRHHAKGHCEVHGNNSAQYENIPPGMLGTMFFILADGVAAHLFIPRPETLSTAFCVGSFYYWITTRNNASQSTLRLGLSGALFSLAVLASPRFLVLAGLFLLPTDTRYPWIDFNLRRMTVFVSSFSLTIVFYLFASPVTLDQFRFIFSFSSLLQRIGEGNQSASLFFVVGFVALLPLTLLGILLSRLELNSRIQILVCTSYVFLVLLVLYLASGQYVYAQSASPLFVLLGLLLVLVQNQLATAGIGRDILFATCIATWVLLFSIRLTIYTVVNSLDLPANLTIFDRLGDISTDLTAMPEGERVLLSPPEHLIFVQDASFYGLILVDSPERICVAARRYQSITLPPCDYVADIENNLPYYVTRQLDSLATGSRLARLKLLIKEKYVPYRGYYRRTYNQ
ncbi:hypothetical protein Thiowin_04299 [Thiorhodovibrio winogradskyi]|uniref:Glycosyltransferase RgtA/B/C/D-like domain-containing protein n=1 Tax=Thiorhodovibrio winogradskyi TaxID=77007 RepID=A0ABZ0SFA8_9GAMM